MPDLDQIKQAEQGAEPALTHDRRSANARLNSRCPPIKRAPTGRSP